MKKNINQTANTTGQSQSDGIFEKLIKINRCTKVVKGGRRFSFSVLMVAGNKKGKVGIGFGKANEISDAIQKSSAQARKNMVSFFLKKENLLLHEVKAKFCSSKVWIKPATPGTGLVAGGSVRILLELLGVHDVISKIRGNRNPNNVLKAAFKALKELRNPYLESQKRGKSLAEIYNTKKDLG